MSILWLPLLIKAVSTALVVVLASALAEVVGPFWGALVASLPVSAGPAYVFLAMQHDGPFVAVSALNSLAANAATGLFLIVYAWLARTASLCRGLGTALSAWFLASLMIRQIDWTPAAAALLNVVVYSAGLLMLPGPATAAPQTTSIIPRRWFDLPLRAAAIAGFVSAVVVGSSMLGPEATGIAAVFPISLTSLIVILQPRIGGAAAALMAATALRAMLGFGAALLTLHSAVWPWGTGAALIAALAVSLLWSCGLLVQKSVSQARYRLRT